MVAWAVVDMGGEIPKQDPRLLADNMAGAAWNTDLVSGPLDSFTRPELVADLSGYAGAATAQRAYRLPGPHPTDPDAWLLLPSPYSSVVRSPLTQDTRHRIYWTNPNDGAYWSTYDDILAGNPPYNLGFVAPDPNYELVVQASGGDTTVAKVERSYVFTLIDSFGNESSPSGPSAVVAGASNGVWDVFGLPGTPQHPLPAVPVGRTYPPIVKVRLYRTITGTSRGATFYQVNDFDVSAIAANPGTVTPYLDTTLDTAITGALILASAGWGPPPPGLDGLLAMPGGFLVGFIGSTLYFSEPDRPHTWPAAYDLSVQYDIMDMGLWNQTLVVLTRGYPSTGTGTAPASFTLSQVQVSEPCLTRGSIVTDLLGVYYASQNGVVQLSYYGMQNQTAATIDQPSWLTKFQPEQGLQACRHRQQYLARKVGDGNAFVIDYSEQRLGVVWTDAMRYAQSIWTDAYNGQTCFYAGGKVYRWDNPTSPPLVYRWRSKLFNLIVPINLAACEITVDPSVTLPAPPEDDAIELRPITTLPAGVNCLFRLFAEGKQVLEHVVRTAPQATFRLPSGYKAHQYQFEILSRVPVAKVKLATSMKELNSV